ncbi:hypothetical protein Tco_1476188 [Tanacetum coccineum]
MHSNRGEPSRSQAEQAETIGLEGFKIMAKLLLVFSMERGSLSSGGRGVKQKKGVNTSGNVSESGNVVTSGNGSDQISQIDLNVNDGTDEPLLTMNTKGLVSFTESIRVVSEWFAYSAYGFFLGKRVTYQVAATMLGNTWCK